MKTLHETSTVADQEPIRLTERGRKIRNNLGKISAAIALVSVAYIGGEAMNSDFHGEQIVHVGDNGRTTLNGLINDNVENHEGHTLEIREQVQSNPDNAKTLANNQLDPGESLELPKSVE